MPRRKLISDEAVLDATERVLLERGPHAFTLVDVSKRAGIAPATLIQRFGTKRGLMRAFALFRRRRPEYRLIVCGMHGFFTEQLRALRDELGPLWWQNPTPTVTCC